jgi:hypothetical protein
MLSIALHREQSPIPVYTSLGVPHLTQNRNPVNSSADGFALFVFLCFF